MEENIRKMIEAFQDKTIDSAIEGFVVEQNDELTNEVRKYLDSLPTEEVLEVQNFLNRLFNYCYGGQLFDIDLDQDYEKIKALTEEQRFLLKETLIYFSGRLSVKPDIALLKRAYHLDNNKYIKLNIAFASLSTFEEDIEMDFVSRLLPGSEYDQMVRSWTMAFFKKAADPYNYVDSSEDDWTPAKTPRLNRLAINDEENPKFKKAMSFRLLDFTVIYLFLENRKASSLTDEEKVIIRDAYIDYPLYSEAKKEKMIELKSKILQK